MNPSDINNQARNAMQGIGASDAWRQMQGLQTRSTVHVLTWMFGDAHGSGMRVYETAQAAEEARSLLEAVNVHATVEVQTVLR